MSAAIPPIINSVPLLITMSKSYYYLRFLSCKGKFGNIKILNIMRICFENDEIRCPV